MVDRKITTGITLEKKIFPFRQFHFPSPPYTELNSGQQSLVKQFNDKVRSGEIEFETVPCLCGYTTFDLVASVDQFSMQQQTVLCKHCGLIESNPRMTQKEYARFYSSDLYRICYESGDYMDLYKAKYTEKTGQHIFDEINKVKEITPDCAVLEIGAGGGWNLLPFIRRGAKASGIDYSPSLVSLGRLQGVPMTQGSIDSVTGTYDVIIINHVLEHLTNPVESLKGILGNLREKGIIYIAVPNIDHFDMDQLQNAHTYYFNPKSLLHYCRLSGLRPVAFGVSETIHMFAIFVPGNEDVSDDDLKDNYREIYSRLEKTKFKQALNILLSRLHLRIMARKIFRSIISREHE